VPREPGTLATAPQVLHIPFAIVSRSQYDSARFDLDGLAEQEIYPRIWDEAPTALLREYYAAFDSVRSFVSGCVERGDALVVHLKS
jgi:hypothetical protein